MIKIFIFFLSGLILITTANAQDSIPACIYAKAKTLAEFHKKNPCQGTDKLKYIDCYSYRDTILYLFVFEKNKPCPDYIDHTIYYDSYCQAHIEIIDGGLFYRHKVVPADADLKLLKFIAHLKKE